MLTALAGEKSVFQPLIFNKLTALGTLSIHGHKVCRPLVQFVGLPRLCPSHLPPTRPFRPGRPRDQFEPIIIA